MKKPSRTVVMVIASSLILSLAFGYRFISDSESRNVTVSNLEVTKNFSVDNKPRNSSEATSSAPLRGNLDQSISTLANQIVENSANQHEAYAFLVEAKSYRIQEMKTRRAKEKADEAKAVYDAAFWDKKMGKIDSELSKDTSNAAVDTQAGAPKQRYDVQTGYRGYEQDITGQADLPKKQKIELGNFVLRAIIREGNSYVARISYGDRTVPAKTGYTILGKVKVQEVSAERVVLKMNDETLPLYSY